MKYFIKKSNTKMIEPEEILLDKSSKEALDDSKLEVAISGRVFIFFLVFILFVFGVFVARAVYFQVFKYDEFSLLAEKNKTRSYPVLANRGVIYDKNMEQLVFNVSSFDLVAVPANFPKTKEEREKEIVKISEAFGLKREDISSKLKNISSSSLYPVLIKESLEREEALFFESNPDDFLGVELKKNSTRNYKDGKYFSHILGYTGKVSESDMLNNKALSSLDYIGKSNVEYIYDDVLRGLNGRIIQDIDSVLRLKEERKVKDEVTGNNLVLSIDSNLQKKIYNELKKQITKIGPAEGASAVALNPKTGEILALVSLPSYDNNIFSKGGERGQYEKIIKNKLKPLFNRAVSGTYPPGSVIKPFIASAALEEEVISENTKINDIGYISVPNKYNPDIVYTFRDWKVGGHGIVSVKDALAVSSNVFFYTIGGGFGDIEGLGIDRIKKYLNFFGFGSPTNIDLGSEESGIVPSPEWKETVKGESWYTGDTYISAIGQGNILVTPLQLASATAVIANDGTLYEPHIVKEILDKDQNLILKTEPKKIRNDFIDEKNIQIVKKGMRMAVTEGSAIRLAGLPVKVAGKTGTAQIGGDDTHAWFTSFAPYDDPEIVLTIMIEKGGEGSAAAVPVAKEVFLDYFKINQATTTQENL